MGFSNKSITAPCKDKPHIVLRDGWWRVSPLRPKELKWLSKRTRWDHAHGFVCRLNSKRGWWDRPIKGDERS